MVEKIGQKKVNVVVDFRGFLAADFAWRWIPPPEPTVSLSLPPIRHDLEERAVNGKKNSFPIPMPSLVLLLPTFCFWPFGKHTSWAQNKATFGLFNFHYYFVSRKMIDVWWSIMGMGWNLMKIIFYTIILLIWKPISLKTLRK